MGSRLGGLSANTTEGAARDALSDPMNLRRVSLDIIVPFWEWFSVFDPSLTPEPAHEASVSNDPSAATARKTRPGPANHRANLPVPRVGRRDGGEHRRS